MFNRCPGQDTRYIRSEVLVCHDCGYEAEIFSDETRTICSGCAKTLYRQILPSCADWCKAARECLGEEKWRELKKRGG